MRRFATSLAMCLLLSACQTQPAPVTAEDITLFKGAQLFDGQGFQPGQICVQARTIVTCPDHPGQTVDLSGQFISPPFGDAHTHHFDGPFTLDWHTGMGLRSGTFYAMTMTAPTRGVVAIRDRLSGPGQVDVATSLGGLTGPDSHPAEIYEALALNIRSFEEQVARAADIQASRRAADDAYFVVESEADVREKMDLLLSNRPDHIKVFLRKSERYDEGYGKWGPGGGVDPSLLPLIAELTDAAGVRLAVANSSVADFRESLAVEADIVTHLPCYQDSAADPDSPYFDVDVAEDCLISTDEAARAARIGLASTLIVTEWTKDRPADIVAWEQQNMARLREADATLIVASNAYGSTLIPGLIAGVQKGFVSPSQMLRMASMTTPQIIFPDRKVGCLEVGCEASFISFSADPLADVTAIQAIAYRMKDGEALMLDEG